MECRFWYRASLVALLAGCAPSGLSPSGSAPIPSLAGAVQSRVPATVVIALPPIHKAGTPIDWTSNSLSSATRTASVKIGAQKFGPIALNATNKHCVHATGGLTCTLVVAAKPGRYGELIVLTYAAGVTQPLAVGHTPKYGTVTLTPGRNVLNIGLAGIAHTIKVIPATTTLPHGQYFLDQLRSQAFDVQHHLIPTREVVSPKFHPFVVLYSYSGFATGTVSWGSYYYSCCGFQPVFPYDGVGEGTETVTGTAYSGPYSETPADLPQATAKLTVVAGNTDFAPLAMGVTIAGNVPLQTIAQFPTTSSSGAAPVRQFRDTYKDPERSSSSYREPVWPMYGEDTSGNFWIGNAKLSNSLSLLGTVTLPSYVSHVSARDYKGHLYGQGKQTSSAGCPIYEFPRQQYGPLKPIREIDGPACGAMFATDSAGNVYVTNTFAVPASGGGYTFGFGVEEFAPKGSGHIAPIRQMVESTEGNDPTFLGLDVDDAGNVYVAAQTSSYTSNPSKRIYKFAPGQTTGTQLLGGLQVNGFAVDGSGDIYAVVAISNATQIEEFAPGSTTPLQTFAATGSSYGLPILLPRYPP